MGGSKSIPMQEEQKSKAANDRSPKPQNKFLGKK